MNLTSGVAMPLLAECQDDLLKLKPGDKLTIVRQCERALEDVARIGVAPTQLHDVFQVVDQRPYEDALSTVTAPLVVHLSSRAPMLSKSPTLSKIAQRRGHASDSDLAVKDAHGLSSLKATSPVD